MNFFKCATITLGLSALVVSAYMVKEGDTLWDLSDEYLHDPFAWPDLWENNRHIQDPHWIYPGDSIYLGDSLRDEPVMQIPADKKKYPCKAAVADSNLPKGQGFLIENAGCDESDERGDEFENMLGNLRDKDKKQKRRKKQDDAYFYKKRSAPKVFNGYYQLFAPEIYTLDSLKNDSSFISIRSGEKKEPIIHIPEMEVVVGIGKKTHPDLKKGTFIEILDAKAVNVPSHKGAGFDKYALLKLSGVAKITAIGDTLSRAVIMQSFREIKMGQSKARLKQPIAPINVTGYSNVNEVTVDSMAQIRLAMDPMLIIGSYSYVLIDKGLEQGYSTGDAVAIWEEDRSDASIPPRLLGRGIIARASLNESAVLVREAYSNNRRIEMGHRVSVTHKADVAK